MNENTEQVVAASGSTLPPMYEKCVVATKDLACAGPESVSLGKGIGLFAAGILMLFAPLLLIGVDSAADHFGLIMLVAVAACFTLIGFSLKHLVLSNLTAGNYAKVEELLGGLLVPDEKLLAVTVAKKSGAGLWLTGFSKNCLLAFTTHRLFLLGIKGVSSAKKALANPQENISVMVCDLGNRERVSKGGLLIPPGFHLFASRINVQPEGQDSSTSWGAFIRFGKNGKLIKSLFARL